MLEILSAALTLGVMGIVFAAILGFASRIFAVEQDERLPKIIEVLPGANCGGCGFPGCSNFASAVVEGKAPVSGCPVGGATVASSVAEIMGQVADNSGKKVAFVSCCGGDNASKKFNYAGISDCNAASKVQGGPTACSYGCFGFGSCEKVCPFDAIHVENGVAKVETEKCTACSKCIAVCPTKIISLTAEKQKVFVPCSSKDKGGVARKVCEKSCIGCKLCEKECPFDAIHVVDNLAVIDEDKCKNCGKCVPVCPRKLIINTRKKPTPKAPAQKPASNQDDLKKAE